ncbi:MAG TPA: lysine decarboxylase, partial [Spirochaetota bacterium]|nr:lysine decarboxylase [Spirochaetota bacterium]
MSKAHKAYKNPEFINSREARTVRILSEYIAPESVFKQKGIHHTVVFFGSARIKPDDNSRGTAEYYNIAKDFSSRLAGYSREL